MATQSIIKRLTYIDNALKDSAYPFIVFIDVDKDNWKITEQYFISTGNVKTKELIYQDYYDYLGYLERKLPKEILEKIPIIVNDIPNLI